MEFPHSSPEAAPLIAGIFVGGRSSRMGRCKGLIEAPGKLGGMTLVERLRAEVSAAVPGISCTLVGARREYEKLGFENLPDKIADQGPLGGLVALLELARDRGARGVLVLACDFPFVQAPLIARLAFEAPEAEILCPHLEERYQPLFGRYGVTLLDSFAQALLDNRRALQPLLKDKRAQILSIDEREAASLVDWDKPEDLLR